MSASAFLFEQWRSMLDAHLFSEATAYQEGEFPKACTTCGARHDETSWRGLPFVRQIVDEEPKEVRNCTCETSLAVSTR